MFALDLWSIKLICFRVSDRCCFVRVGTVLPPITRVLLIVDILLIIDILLIRVARL